MTKRACQSQRCECQEYIKHRSMLKTVEIRDQRPYGLVAPFWQLDCALIAECFRGRTTNLPTHEGLE